MQLNNSLSKGNFPDDVETVMILPRDKGSFKKNDKSNFYIVSILTTKKLLKNLLTKKSLTNNYLFSFLATDKIIVSSMF